MPAAIVAPATAEVTFTALFKKKLRAHEGILRHSLRGGRLAGGGRPLPEVLQS